MRSRILLFFLFFLIFFLQKLRNDLEIIRCHMAFHLTERDNLMIYKFVTYLADQGTQSNFLIFLFLNFWAMEDILTAFLLPFATSCSAKI